MKTAATDGDATERAIAAAEAPLIDRPGPTGAAGFDGLIGSHEVTPCTSPA